MNQELKLVFEIDEQLHKLQSILGNGIRDYAFEKKGHKPIESFGISLRGEDNEIKGGCSGIAYYGCLYIDQLWIDKHYRGTGFGRKLMEEG